jgi:UDP-glucuronate 4-epimerase
VTLVTGAAGFIGFHMAHRLLVQSERVVGLDNLNDYYDPGLKEARLEKLRSFAGFRFAKMDLADRGGLLELFARERFHRVIHFAAQAGVRYSVDHPHVYAESNVAGFLNVLEAARHFPVEHLVFASSSSVYGGAAKLPFAVGDPVDKPVSLYAATKVAGELMAHCYAHLYAIPVTALRFFTVYGPWGRPDMAPCRFARAILAGTPIDIYNYGHMRRDFTYVDDIVEGVHRVLGRNATGYRIYNIGATSPVELMDFIEILERALGRVAEKRFLPMQPGDVLETHADVSDLEREFDFRPRVGLEEGIAQFARWFLDYYGDEIQPRARHAVLRAS